MIHIGDRGRAGRALDERTSATQAKQLNDDVPSYAYSPLHRNVACMIHENVYGTADTPLPKAENRDRHCRSPEKNHSGQYVVCGDPDTHRQPAKTRDIIPGFQAGRLKREHPGAKTDAIGPVNTPSSNDTTGAGMISAANPASN